MDPKWSAALLGSILSAAIASVLHSSDAFYMTWWGLIARGIFSFSLREELTAWKVWLHNIIIRLLETPLGNGMTHLRRWPPSCRSCATNPLQSNTGQGWLSIFSNIYIYIYIWYLVFRFKPNAFCCRRHREIHGKENDDYRHEILIIDPGSVSIGIFKFQCGISTTSHINDISRDLF